MNTRKVIDYITHEITHKTGGLDGTMQHRQRQKKLIILPTDPSTQWTTTKQKKKNGKNHFATWQTIENDIEKSITTHSEIENRLNK